MLLISNSFAASTQWVKLETPSFTLYTRDNERQARRAAAQFEQVHRFFEASWRKLDRDKPIRIISFDGYDQQYNLITDRKNSAALYLSAPDADYIVMRDLTPQSFPIAVHEYVHLIVRHAGLKLPVWLNEGLAEVYSTLQERDKKVLIGNLPPHHLSFLNSTTLYPLEELLSITHGHKVYGAGNNDTHRLYAQSWALVHMLMLSKEYSARFPQLLKAAEKEQITPADIEAALGVSLPQISKDLDNYIRRASYRGLLFNTKLEHEEEVIRPAKLADGEAEMTLASLQLYRKDWQQFAGSIQTLAGQYAQSPLAHEMLAIAAYRATDPAAEERHLERALTLGSTSPYLIMRFASLTRNKPELHQLTLDAYQKSLATYPGHIDLITETSFHLGRMKKPYQAFALTVPVKTVTPRKAPRFFLARAYALVGTKQFDQATSNLNTAAQWATEEIDLRNIESLRSSLASYVARSHQAEATARAGSSFAPASAQDSAQDSPAPRLRKPSGGELPTAPPALDETPPPAEPGEAHQTLSATFQEFLCEHLIFVFRLADGKLLRLHLPDTKNLEVRGTGSVTVDLHCGPQSAKPVKLAFLPQNNTANKTSGILRMIEFQSSP
ncbi:MAG: hypothetical protein NW208_15115 [Bryobacter sp.]|nr:hypothetical protein [Bryobacter sp.]